MVKSDVTCDDCVNCEDRPQEGREQKVSATIHELPVFWSCELAARLLLGSNRIYVKKKTQSRRVDLENTFS